MILARLHFRILAAAVALAVLWSSSRQARSVEQVENFITGLKHRGLHDYALLYMEQMKNSPLASAEFRKNIDFEQGTTLVDYARITQDKKLRDDLFEQAREKLDAFSRANSGTLMGAKANTELANVLVERGRASVRMSEMPSQSSNKDSLLDEARQLFDEAKTVFENSERFYSQELERFPKSLDPNRDKEQFDQRQAFRAELVQSRLLIATVIYEKAKTYDPESEDGKKLLTEAAEAYGELYEKYRRWLAGMYARLYQGRCHQDMKDYKIALSYYEDLLQQDENEPVFRTLITKTYVNVAQALLDQEKYDECIDRCGTWAKKARGAEGRNEDFLALKYFVALALERNIPLVKDDKNAVKNHAKAALDFATEVARYPGDFQKQGKDLLARIRDRGDDTEGDPTTFTEAFDEGREAVTAMSANQSKLPVLKQTAPDEVPAMEEKIVEDRDSAIRYFNLALKLVDEETDVDQINFVRYYLCFLNWETKDYYRAAVLGEFLANKYPDSAGARPGAKIAMAAYLAVYNQDDNDDQEFEARKIVEVAELITKRWPGGTEADDANNMLVTFKVQQKKFDEAEQYLEKISAGFKDRGKAELRLGQALWSHYIRSVRLPETERPAKDELEAAKLKAQATLEKGVERMRTEPEITTTIAGAALSLAQIYLDTQQFEKAVAMLEDDQIGPLVLVAQGHNAVDREGFAEEVYKAALRAYVTVQPPELDKAELIMDTLEQMVQGDKDAAETLTKIFIGLGLQLQDSLQLIEDEQQKKVVARSFEVFLDRISARSQGNTWASRNWVASTFYRLGTGFDDGGTLNPQAKKYYVKAIQAYQKIINEVKEKKLASPSEDAILGVQMRLAECMRNMGDYRGSLNLMAAILEKKPMMLEGQRVAAQTYQLRGDQENPAWYKFAMLGGRKNKETQKNRIWGWARLANIVAKYPQHKDVFHEARYNLALCRHEFAKKQETAADRQKYQEMAKKDIFYLVKLYADLGGEEWRDKYDRLLKDIQKSLREKPEGLKAFKEPETPVTNQTAQR